jgi:hypothetical protein
MRHFNKKPQLGPAALIVSLLACATSSFSQTEVTAMYTDLGDAYIQGRLADARQLATRYLNYRQTQLRSARDAAYRAEQAPSAIFLVRLLVAAEERLKPGDRSVPLLLQAEDLLTAVKEADTAATDIDSVGVSLARGDASQYLGETAELWLRASNQVVAPSRRAMFFQRFGEELGRRGVTDLRQTQIPPESRPVRTLTSQEKVQLIQAVRDYFDSIRLNDAGTMAKVRGMHSSDGQRLLDAAKNKFRLSGVVAINAVHIPEAQAVPDTLGPMPGTAGLYLFDIHGVELDVTKADGSKDFFAPNSTWVVSVDSSGKWIVEQR